MPRNPALSISSTPSASWSSQTKTLCEQTKPRPKSSTLRKLKTSLFSLSKEFLSDADFSDASHSSAMQSHRSKQKPHSRLARINTSFSSLSSTISSASSHCSTPSWSSSSASTAISHQSFPSPIANNLSRASTSSPASARSPSSVVHQFPFPLVTLEEAAETHELVLGKESYELYDSNDNELGYGYGYETARSSSPILDSFGGSLRGGQKHLIHFERQSTPSEKASTSPHSSYFSYHSYPGCNATYYSGLDSGFMDDLLPPLPARVSEALEAAAECRRRPEL